jgi:hypothetical protein
VAVLSLKSCEGISSSQVICKGQRRYMANDFQSRRLPVLLSAKAFSIGWAFSSVTVITVCPLCPPLASQSSVRGLKCASYTENRHRGCNGRYPTLFVPVSSVASDLQRTFVIRVRQNKTEWVDVNTGVKVGNLIEVFGDLHEGDAIATRGTDQLRAGTEVSSRVVNSK